MYEKNWMRFDIFSLLFSLLNLLDAFFCILQPRNVWTGSAHFIAYKILQCEHTTNGKASYIMKNRIMRASHIIAVWNGGRRGEGEGYHWKYRKPYSPSKRIRKGYIWSIWSHFSFDLTSKMFEIFALKVFAILPLDISNRMCYANVRYIHVCMYTKYWILMKTDDRHCKRNDSHKWRVCCMHVYSQRLQELRRTQKVIVLLLA